MEHTKLDHPAHAGLLERTERASSYTLVGEHDDFAAHLHDADYTPEPGRSAHERERWRGPDGGLIVCYNSGTLLVQGNSQAAHRDLAPIVATPPGDLFGVEETTLPAPAPEPVCIIQPRTRKKPPEPPPAPPSAAIALGGGTYQVQDVEAFTERLTANNYRELPPSRCFILRRPKWDAKKTLVILYQDGKAVIRGDDLAPARRVLDSLSGGEVAA